MKSLGYYYGKFFKKILRGKCISNSTIDRTVVINSGCSIVNSDIGRYSYLGYDCQLNKVSIGRYCSLANDIIIGGAEHPIDWLSTSPVFQNVSHSGPRIRFAYHNIPREELTIIGNDVWIGNRAIIKQGVTIHDGAIVGAGAVVTKDVPPYAIVAGVPARVIKYRFDEKTISDLLNMAWWNMKEEDLIKHADKVTNIREFIDAMNNQHVDNFDR